MREEHQERVGRAIARLREQQGWSQRQLARWVGLDQSAVSRIEAGRRRVTARELQAFADAFHVSADAVLKGPLADAMPAPVRADLASAPSASTPRAAWMPDEGAPSVAFMLDENAPEAWQPAPAPSRRTAWEAVQRHARERFTTSHAETALVIDPDARAEHAGARADLGDDLGPDLGADLVDGLHGDLGDGLRDDLGDSLRSSPPAGNQGVRAAVRAEARPAHGYGTPAFEGARAADLPPEVAAVIADWFELRGLSGGSEPAQTWSLGHSAEGKPARLAQPVHAQAQPSGPGDVLYDRVARFWRSELHVEPDDGPLPDLVTLLEDGLGAQVIVARVAAPAGAGPTDPRKRRRLRATARLGGEAAPPLDGGRSHEHPVAASVTAGDIPFLFVNAARPVVLQRFALAHAFAHLVLGHGDIVDQRIYWSRNNPREAAANDFTEELLAPVRAVQRWYERHGEPRSDMDTLLRLANAFGISAWSALYRSRAAGRIRDKQFGRLNQELHAFEWELLPRQAFLGGLRDSLAHLTPQETLPPGRFGPPAVLRVPGAMRSWALAAIAEGRLSLERAARYLQTDARELAAQLARLGLE